MILHTWSLSSYEINAEIKRHISGTFSVVFFFRQPIRHQCDISCEQTPQSSFRMDSRVKIHKENDQNVQKLACNRSKFPIVVFDDIDIKFLLRCFETIPKFVIIPAETKVVLHFSSLEPVHSIFGTDSFNNSRWR